MHYKPRMYKQVLMHQHMFMEQQCPVIDTRGCHCGALQPHTLGKPSFKPRPHPGLTLAVALHNLAPVP